ncbi:MAG TPA: PadR family transcriptional regulator [Streptosporangiaceae bacterium]|jgi:DNA-binding PadR family transcriptional regulator
MPLHHAVLALLATKPAHGYELKGSFEQAVGEQWGGLNIGHLYQILDRLSRDGLIESQRQPQPIKPDRVVHHITPAGRAELDRWLDEPSPRTRGYRDDFFLKVMAAAQAGDAAALTRVITQQRTHLLTELRALAEARAAGTPPAVVSLLLTAAELHARADLGVTDAAEEFLYPDVLAALAVKQGPGGRGQPVPGESGPLTQQHPVAQLPAAQPRASG